MSPAGPLTMMRGATQCVVLCASVMSSRGIAARHARPRRDTGRCPGRQPAMTALTVTLSMRRVTHRRTDSAEGGPRGRAARREEDAQPERASVSPREDRRCGARRAATRPRASSSPARMRADRDRSSAQPARMASATASGDPGHLGARRCRQPGAVAPRGAGPDSPTTFATASPWVQNFSVTSTTAGKPVLSEPRPSRTVPTVQLPQ